MLTQRTEFFITAFLGFTGIHRFLKKEIKLGFLYLFTAGLFYIGWITDTVKAYHKMKQVTEDSLGVYDCSSLGKRTVSPNMNYNQQIQDMNRRISLVPDYHSIDSMEGIEFEKYCAELLRKLGYIEIVRTPGSGDQGVDIVAVKNDIRYAIQCKRYSSDLGNTPIQEVVAGKAF